MKPDSKTTKFLKEHWVMICLTIIITTGFLLRVYNLGFQGYFSEELFTVEIVKNSYYQILLDPSARGGSEQPPIYFLLAKLSSDLMGSISSESIRAPAALLGTLGIPAIYTLGKKYHTELSGLIAAVIYALSDRMVFYSQYGRPYTLVFLFFIIAAYCFVSIQKKEAFSKYIFLFAISSILCLLSHYYSIVPLSVLWIVLIWQHREKTAPYLLIAAIASISFLSYVKILFFLYLTYPLSQIYTKKQFSLTWVDNLSMVPYECFGYLGFILLAVAVFYFLTSRDKTALYFLAAYGITHLSLLAATIFFDPSARYTVLVAPLIIVVAAAPVSTAILSCRNIKHRIALAAGVIYIIILANIFPLVAWYTTAYRFVFV